MLTFAICGGCSPQPPLTAACHIWQGEMAILRRGATNAAYAAEVAKRSETQLSEVQAAVDQTAGMATRGAGGDMIAGAEGAGGIAAMAQTVLVGYGVGGGGVANDGVDSGEKGGWAQGGGGAVAGVGTAEVAAGTAAAAAAAAAAAEADPLLAALPPPVFVLKDRWASAGGHQLVGISWWHWGDASG